jgi:excisionase family DNA binding protein
MSHDAIGPPLMNAREVAELLGLSPNTILDWWEQGQLPGFKLGRAVRFRPDEILAWIEDKRRTAVA